MYPRYASTLILLAAILMSGCVSVGHQFLPVKNPDPSKALVYVYRPHPQPNILLTNTYGYVHAADVYIGDDKWVSLNVNAYSAIELPAGKYSFSMRDNIARGALATLDVELVAGQQYYCRYDFHFGLDTAFSLRIIPEELARQEIVKTRMAQPSEDR